MPIGYVGNNNNEEDNEDEEDDEEFDDNARLVYKFEYNSVDKLNQCYSTVSTNFGEKRPPKESKEEKLARKKAVKELRKVCVY